VQAASLATVGILLAPVLTVDEMIARIEAPPTPS
jgi:hypothetical protein